MSEQPKTANIYLDSIDINLKSIYCFIKVVESKNVTKAAEELYISQPHLSKLIKNLEEKLGFALFEREKNRLIITKKGEEFYNAVKPAVFDISKIIEDAKYDDRPKINISVAESIDFYKLKESGFINPDFNFENSTISCSDCFKIHQELNEGLTDSAIMPEDYATNFRGFEIKKIGRAGRSIIVSKNHKFARRNNIANKELNGEKMIFFIEKDIALDEANEGAKIYFDKYGINPFEVSFVKNYQSALVNASIDNKIIFSTTVGIEANSENLVSIPILDSYVDICAVFSKSLSPHKKEALKNFYTKME